MKPYIRRKLELPGLSPLARCSELLEGGAVRTRVNATRQGTVCRECFAPVEGTGYMVPESTPSQQLNAQQTGRYTDCVISTTQLVFPCCTAMPWPRSVAAVTFPSFCLIFLWRILSSASVGCRKFQIDSVLLAVALRETAISGRGVNAELFSNFIGYLVRLRLLYSYSAGKQVVFSLSVGA